MPTQSACSGQEGLGTEAGLPGGEERLAHLVSVLRALRRVSQVITTEKQPDRLIALVCQSLVEAGAYPAVWGALIEEGKVTAFASTGLHGLHEAMKRRFEEGPLPNCARRALDSEGVACVGNPPQECGDCPLAMTYAGRAGLSLRLSAQGRTAGILGVSSSAAFAADGEVAELLGDIAGDLSRALGNIAAEPLRDLAAAELRQQEELFRTFFDNAPIGKCMTSPSGHLLRVNRALSEMLGYSTAEMEVMSFADVTHPDDVAESLEHVQSLLSGERDSWEFEKRYIAKSGRIVWAHVTSRLQRDEGGRPLHLLTHIQDITQRREAEQQLLRLSEDLARSNQELEQFAYVASHDLQEPLRMVSSYTQLLARRYKDKLDQDALDFIGFATDGASRMQRMIQDLLTYSRITTRGMPLETLDIHEALEEALLNLQMTVRETGALVTSGELPLICGDSTQIAQLLQNLIGNGIKFHHPGEPPRVHLSAEQDPEHEGFWLFTVADNGIGIESKYFHRLFVIFQRLHTKQEYPGTGIGLALCKRIVQRHGGRIWIESNPGKGTTVCFTLPGSVKEPGISEESHDRED